MAPLLLEDGCANLNVSKKISAQYIGRIFLCLRFKICLMGAPEIWVKIYIQGGIAGARGEKISIVIKT
jgi:hypothetical protein